MKIILLFSLICFTLSVWGPADKIKNSNSNGTCFKFSPNSLSEWVDLKLNVGDEYYDRCCYIRYQYNGGIHTMCYPWKEEGYLDITETIREFEDGYQEAFGIEDEEGKKCKVYQFECAASNIKFLFISSILFALLL